MSRNHRLLPWLMLSIIPAIGLLLLGATQTVQPANSEKVPATSLTAFLNVKFPTMTPRPTNLPAGEAAPTFTLKSLDGKVYSLDAFRGKHVVLNFWATWCGPCRIEMPMLEKVYKQSKDKDLVILAVNNGEAAEVAQQYVDELGLTFPVLLDTDAVVFHEYGVFGLPTTFLWTQLVQSRIKHPGRCLSRI